MRTVKMPRWEIEENLVRKYLNECISITLPGWARKVTGKVQQISVDIVKGEPMVVFMFADYYQYKADVNYFLENAEIL